jgi:hypothetical protein
VWSPCVEARTFPSGLNAAAIVDLGAGNKGQYLADKCRSESASTHDRRPRFASLATCFVLGEISLRASKLKTLLQLKNSTHKMREIL